mmetsp:Transcript_71193/g.225048  ORF Transcript_71193/g.225048 Transcript_71193/m.225048 type:complete len:214 (+) Transcript_71193:201-842(+)
MQSSSLFLASLAPTRAPITRRKAPPPSSRVACAAAPPQGPRGAPKEMVARRSFGAGAAAGGLLALLGPFVGGAGPALASDYRAVIAGDDYFADTRELIVLIGDLLDGKSLDLARFEELASAWEETHKLKHLGQDRSYIATFKCIYAIRGTAGTWSELKGYYSTNEAGEKVPFDPEHTNFKKKAIRKYVDDCQGYLDEGLPVSLLAGGSMAGRV